jgi:hypothetical protein
MSCLGEFFYDDDALNFFGFLKAHKHSVYSYFFTIEVDASRQEKTLSSKPRITKEAIVYQLRC